MCRRYRVEYVCEHRETLSYRHCPTGLRHRSASACHKTVWVMKDPFPCSMCWIQTFRGDKPPPPQPVAQPTEENKQHCNDIWAQLETDYHSFRNARAIPRSPTSTEPDSLESTIEKLIAGRSIAEVQPAMGVTPQEQTAGSPGIEGPIIERPVVEQPVADPTVVEGPTVEQHVSTGPSLITLQDFGIVDKEFMLLAAEHWWRFTQANEEQPTAMHVDLLLSMREALAQVCVGAQESILQENQLRRARLLLTATGLEALPSDQPKECAICLERYHGEDMPCRTQCGHVFGAQCIQEWLNEQVFQTCPLCRGPFPTLDMLEAQQAGWRRVPRWVRIMRAIANEQ